MTNPQIEGDDIRVATEMLGALMRIRLSSQESRVVIAVIGQPHGREKKELSNLTGISRSHICDTLKKLEKRNILTRNGKEYSLQGNYTEWSGIKLPIPPLSFPEEGKSVPQTGNGEALKEGQDFPEQDSMVEVAKKEERIMALAELILDKKRQRAEKTTNNDTTAPSPGLGKIYPVWVYEQGAVPYSHLTPEHKKLIYEKWGDSGYIMVRQVVNLLCPYRRAEELTKRDDERIRQFIELMKK